MTQAVRQLKRRLKKAIPARRLIDDPLHTLAYGTDASFYRLIPQLVVLVETENEVAGLLKEASALQVSVTFRAAGTSLSGQAISDSVLAVLSGNQWKKREVLDNGHKITLQPGVIGSEANDSLRPYQRKIGPDPASIASAKIGGIAANNASGMCCGTAHNSYNTLQGMRVVFVDGTILDTRSSESIAAFCDSHIELITGLYDIHKYVCSNQSLFEKIRHKYRLKNTTGYGLNALIDFEDPIDILQHLLIGSEGTLGFISEITYQTVEDHPYKCTALVSFYDIEVACNAVQALKQLPVDAVEMMDRSALRSVENMEGMPSYLTNLPDGATALLIDIRADSKQLLQEKANEVLVALKNFSVLIAPEFTDDPSEYQRLWNIRKGLFPAIGSVRKTGTTVIIEDVAFPLECLAAGTVKLQQLFIKHGYTEAIIFGHALAGNLHFVFTQDFASPSEVERYDNFMHEVSELVALEYGGSLKAEHGTGRNMAPFVEMEWGSDAYSVMQRIKTLFDPENLLNPGVILNDNPGTHLDNLKPLPQAHSLIDKCIECGFCESVCPSRNLTLTPRQRIVTQRELARAKNVEDKTREKELLKNYKYAVLDTCAADGLCAELCPVGINTGDMVKSIRSRKVGRLAKTTAKFVQNNLSSISATTRTGLKVLSTVTALTGESFMEKSSSTLRRVSGNRIPSWDRYIPGAASKPIRRSNPGINGKVIYFSSCISRTLGTSSEAYDNRDLQEVILSLTQKAGFKAILPEEAEHHCCGMPYSSKGILETASNAASRLENILWDMSDNGSIPVLCDTSPCTMRMIETFTKPLRIYEPAGFILKYLLPHLHIEKKESEIALHITCSARKMGQGEVLKTLAELCASHVVIPEEQGCCGFAGDKGFTTPELNAKALENLRSQIPDSCNKGVSNSLTCEIGLSRHSGIAYQSIAYLIDDCSSACGDPIPKQPTG